MTVQEKIMARLNPPQEAPCRQIQIKLREDQVLALEDIAKALTARSGKRVTRNMLIADAVEALIIDTQKSALHSDQMES